MRPIDADVLQTALVDEYSGTTGYAIRMGFYRAIEIVQRQPTIAPPLNDPLTLEELREMDGEPVWVEALDYGVSRWAFVAADCEVVRYFTTRSNVACDVIARQFKTYGKTWLAYRRKPEEGTTA